METSRLRWSCVILFFFSRRVGSNSTLMAVPLPNNMYTMGTPSHQAYETCRTLKAGHAIANWSSPLTVVCARLLSYLIIHSPTKEGRMNIMTEINSCNNAMNLHNLAKFYIDHFICPCTYLWFLIQSLSDMWRIVKQCKGRTPVPSSHISRPSFDEMQVFMKYLLKEPPQSHKEAKRAVCTSHRYLLFLFLI